jgi:hypothetical protein
MKVTLASRIIATSIAVSLTVSPAMAKSADTLQDLVGAHGAGGETQLRARGFEFAKSGGSSGNAVTTYWWNDSRKDCVKVVTSEGRYSAITDASHGDCGKGSGSGGAIAAGVIGAAVLGAILLSRRTGTTATTTTIRVTSRTGSRLRSTTCNRARCASSIRPRPAPMSAARSARAPCCATTAATLTTANSGAKSRRSTIARAAGRATVTCARLTGRAIIPTMATTTATWSRFTASAIH